MFAVIYRGFVKPECEESYKKAWKSIANYFVNTCGAIGSVLHRTKQGEYVAYSRWPSKSARDAVWGETKHLSLPVHIESALQELKLCIDFNQPYEEIELDIIDDL